MSHPPKKKSDLLKENDCLQVNHQLFDPSKDVVLNVIADEHQILNGALKSSLANLKSQGIHHGQDCVAYSQHHLSMK